MFDQLQIIREASTCWNGKIAADILARVEFLPGDMFESLPEAVSEKDLYVFFAIFHALSDEQSSQVLSNLKSAIGDKNAYILIGDAVAGELNIDAVIASFDMQMLMGTEGRERTLGEWKKLLAGSDFKIVEVVEVRTLIKYIIATPIVSQAGG